MSTTPADVSKNNGVDGPEAKPADDMISLGSTGLARSGGMVFEEWLPRLRGSRARRVYREMRDNEALIGASLKLTENLIVQADWMFQPADDSEAATRWAEFVTDAAADMEHTFESHLSSALSMLPFGWSYHETVYKVRDDGLIGWLKHELRGQNTLDEWDFDESGGVRGMWQSDTYAPGRGRVFIPASKALHYVTTDLKNNPEGHSALRSAYTSYYYKKHLTELEAIGIERELTGLPMMEVPIGIMSSSASPKEQSIRTGLETLLQKIRMNERAALMLPAELDSKGKHTGYKFRLITSGGKRSIDVRSAVVWHATQMAISLFTEFMLLGSQSVGSFALHSDKTNLFGLALSGYMDKIAAVWNRDAIPRLMTLNDVPRELWPKLVHGDVESVNFQQLAQAIFQLVSAGVLTPDDDLEAHVRETGMFPSKPEGVARPEPKAADEPVEERDDHVIALLKRLEGGHISKGIAHSILTVMHGLSETQAKALTGAIDPDDVSATP